MHYIMAENIFSERTFDMEKTKQKKEKLSLRRTFSNNVFMLKLLHKAAKGRIAIEIAVFAAESIVEFFSWQYLLRYVVNGIEEGKDIISLMPMVIGMCLLNIALIAVKCIWYEIYSGLFYQNAARYFQELVYRKAAKVELACYENPDFYDKYVKALNETTSRADGVATSVSMVVYQSISLMANAALMLTIDPALLLFLIFPLFAIFFVRKSKQTDFDKYTESVKANRKCEYTRRTFYLAEYAKEMRLTGIYRVMFRRFGEAIEEAKNIIRKYGFRSAAWNYLIEIFIGVFATLGATGYAVYQTLVTGNILYGDCLVVISAISILSWSIFSSADSFIAFEEHAMYIENLRHFLGYEPKIKTEENHTPMKKGELELCNVSFRYDGTEKYVLKNINIRCGANEKIALVGHNGAGKSTLVKLMMRLYDPTEGKLRLAGEDIRRYSVEEYREAFSAVFQDFHVFSLSVSENVLLRPIKDGDEEKVRYALEKSGASERVSEMPHGTDTILTREFDKNGEVLSGGETQKLAIAHAFTKDNMFVILDEPTSALDPIAEHEMYKNMMEACKDCGMIFISHRLSSAVMADRIYLLENGEVAECGTHEELMAKNGKYADMFRKQAENYVETEAAA